MFIDNVARSSGELPLSLSLAMRARECRFSSQPQYEWDPSGGDHSWTGDHSSSGSLTQGDSPSPAPHQPIHQPTPKFIPSSHTASHKLYRASRASPSHRIIVPSEVRDERDWDSGWAHCPRRWI